MATQKFEVRDGFTFGANNEHKAGDVLELHESAGVAFADKLKPVGKRSVDSEDGKEGQGSKNAAPLAYLTAKQKSALLKAGYAVQADLDKATDEQLLAVEGVNDEAVKEIRDNKGK